MQITYSTDTDFEVDNSKMNSFETALNAPSRRRRKSKERLYTPTALIKFVSVRGGLLVRGTNSRTQNLKLSKQASILDRCRRQNFDGGGGIRKTADPPTDLIEFVSA